MQTNGLLELLNNRPSTHWDESAWIGYSPEQIEMLRRGWHAGVYAAALALADEKPVSL